MKVYENNGVIEESYQCSQDKKSRGISYPSQEFVGGNEENSYRILRNISSWEKVDVFFSIDSELQNLKNYYLTNQNLHLP